MDYSELSGKVITPIDKEYNTLRKEYNLSINKFPLTLVYCYNSQDVANAIKWSRQYGVEIRIRSGKHNYEGYSTGNGVLVIDTSYMNKIEINTEQNTVKIEAGARLAAIYTKLYQSGYGFPGGTCPTVAISGVVLGGGIGLSSRLHGLATDNLLELQLIDAEGNLLTANKDINPDLFWACRGAGGGNFGVAVSYTFKLFKVEEVTLIQLRWTPECRGQFLDLWQHWLRTADRRISCFAGFNDEEIFLNSFFYGTVEEAKIVLRNFLSLKGLLPESSIKPVPFIDAVMAIASQYDPPNPFKATGRFVYRHLSKDIIRKLVKYVDNTPSKGSGWIRLYSLGGAVSDVANNETAFYFRNAHYIMAITAEWNEEEDASLYKSWVADGFNFIETFTDGSYVNFPYRKLSNYLYKYYGNNVDRLKKVKKLYDPQNIFKFHQSIR